MFGSTVIEVGIGIIFAYLLLSLVVSAANEFIATVFRLRAKNLRKGIESLLADDEWTKKFFDHQLIDALCKKDHPPSYISSAAFADVVMHLVHQMATGSDKAMPGDAKFDAVRDAVDKINNPALRQALLPLIERARADLAAGVAELKKVQDQVAAWYDQVMDRASGWYKRRIQILLFFIALGFAAAMNVDTVSICRRLSTDQTLRASVVEAAKQYTVSAGAAAATAAAKPADPGKPSTPPAPADPDDLGKALAAVQQQVGQMRGVGLPIGWSFDDADSQKPRDDNWNDLWAGHTAVSTKLLGLLVTAFAASLGAPFWFDMLSKLMTVRGSGKSPEERAAEQAKTQAQAAEKK